MHPAREEASLLLLFPPGQRSSPLGEEGHYATLRGVKSQLRHEPNDRTREGKTDCKTAPISSLSLFDFPGSPQNENM